MTGEMTGQSFPFRPFGGAGETVGHVFVRVTFKKVLQMIDLPIEVLVAAVSWAGRALARRRRQSEARRARPLQVISALSMVDDHLLRDVGLDRSAIAAVGVLSAEEIGGCRIDREAS